MSYLISAGENYIKLLPFFIILELIILLACKKDNLKVPPGFVWGIQALAFFITFLLVITGESGILDFFHYDSSLRRPDQINLMPFERAHQDTFGFVMNLIVFVPFGILLPTLWQSFNKFYKTIAAGFCLSLAIEISQLFNLRATDIDDLFMNTMGTIMGYILFLVFFRSHKRYFQLRNEADSSDIVRRSGHIFIICAFLGSYIIRPIINLWI